MGTVEGDKCATHDARPVTAVVSTGSDATEAVTQARSDGLNELEVELAARFGIRRTDAERAAWDRRMRLIDTAARCCRCNEPLSEVWRVVGADGWVLPHCADCVPVWKTQGLREDLCGHCERMVFERPRSRYTACCGTCRAAMARERRRDPRAERTCDCCSAPFVPTRADARYCSNACRQAAYRIRKAVGSSSSPSPKPGATAVQKAVRIGAPKGAS